MELCKFYKKGICNHGFSGKKGLEGKETCSFHHPKICGKLFYSDNRCKDLKDVCEEFHPKLCYDEIKHNFSNKECKEGFHHWSLRRKSQKGKPSQTVIENFQKSIKYPQIIMALQKVIQKVTMG